MAEKRMFSMKIVGSDAFTDMPLSTQALYFHLGMRADDDGFLNNAKKIMREIGANQNDYDLLLMKRFIIQLPNGINVIKHWKVNNYIRKDRYVPTLYDEEKSMLSMKPNGAYTIVESKGTPCITVSAEVVEEKEVIIDEIEVMSEIELKEAEKEEESTWLQSGIPVGDIDKKREEEKREEKIIKKDVVHQEDIQMIVDAWNSIGHKPISKLLSTSERYKMLTARIREYSVEDVLRAIENVRYSSFLRGSNGWSADFGWVVRPNNFPKVLEGNYGFDLKEQEERMRSEQPEGEETKWQ